MACYKQLIILLLIVQVLTLCWARYRIEPSDWEDFGYYDNGISSINAIRESDLMNKFIPIVSKHRSALRGNSQLIDRDRRKKFLADPTNIQGLWTMPGRR